jgi:hypothetical protein
VPHACISCAESKVRCEGTQPCSRCQAKTQVCKYKQSRKRSHGTYVDNNSSLGSGDQAQTPTSMLSAEDFLLMSRSNVPQNGSFLHSQHQQSITHKTFPNLQHTEMTKAPDPVPADHFQDQSPARWSNRRVLTSTIARPSNVD